MICSLVRVSTRLLTCTLGLALLWTTTSSVRGDEPAPQQITPRVSVSRTGNTITIGNGFAELAFDRVLHRVTHLSADHTGEGRFSMELLGPGGIEFEGDVDGKPATVSVIQPNPQHASVAFRWTMRNQRGTTVQLIFSLNAHERGVHVEAVLPASTDAANIRVTLRQWFLLGIFERGAVQYVAGQDQSFSSTNPLRLFYTIDRTNGSVALEPDAAMPPKEVSLISGTRQTESGIVLHSRVTMDHTDMWRSGRPITSISDPEKTSSRIGFTLYANDLPYPAHRDDSRVDGMEESRARELTAYFTAVYGSAASVLGSYFDPGSAYPTLAHPKRAYGDSFDFFDPDSWEVVTALAYSGDPLLQTQARGILERSEAAQNRDGQIPHHFEHGAPTFLSIAGSSQTGPNIFWTLAAIEYAAATGDEKWLRLHYAHLRMATEWVLVRYDPTVKLIHADGPLFIDVFRRSGFTLDTNVFTYDLLARMSRVAAFCNDPATAKRYLFMREEIREGMLRQLWNGRDHFITERHADGSMRDFIDYDGNFAALAFDILPDKADARKVLARLDSGPHTHPGGYGTWVSERRYEKQDCYKDNDGDSDVAMARIWWLDMATRVRIGDRAAFDALFDTAERDLLRNVWMPERYDAQGRPAHNSYYHEYPEVLAMVLREMRYGVHVDMQDVVICPFGVPNFSLHLGGLRVDYSPTYVSLLVPGSSERTFTLAGLVPGQKYALSTGQRLTADKQGTVRFHAKAGRNLVVTLGQ